MSEWDDYPEEELTRENIKELITEELDEYHWKYVAPLIEQLKKDGKTPKQSNEYAFYPKITAGKYSFDTYKNISEYHTFFQTLGILLYQEGYIRKSDHNIFLNSFDGIGNPRGKNKIEWIGAKNHCTYLIDCLIDQNIILASKRDKNVEQIFGIKNPAQIRIAYWYNKNKKPKDYETIDNIIETSFKANPFMYETLNKPLPTNKK